MVLAKKTFAVAAIRNGTVIDHIDAGHALKIVKFLKLASHQKQVTLGLNLPSNTLGFKDIIKVEDLNLTSDEANQVAILAPNASINIIQNYEVTNKFKVAMPKSIEKVICCPNPQCISNYENTKSLLNVLQRVKNDIALECHYCKNVFTYEEIR